MVTSETTLHGGVRNVSETAGDGKSICVLI
jgi:hypothetical protein